MIHLARRLRRVLRLPALVLLLLATLANPVLATVGDTHEAALGHAAHLHDVDMHGTDNNAALDADEDSGDLLHALIHAAHCCGHLSALPVALFFPLARPSASLAPCTEPVLPVGMHPAFAIRPPIAS
ncbi:hypothetical protein [Pseudoxanthomonas sp.]|uniref:hypothetical protein n=1 Tax=Pseudoxanthomonas sp. TaxID=1871049 RepID=UPI00261C9307|nr:hypothetical protein [Pseudoxanthomonas sp.]WDS38002.1 MAG: hypothetical protein O8I58_09150 [Pseudoxanthomonas sp.]